MNKIRFFVLFVFLLSFSSARATIVWRQRENMPTGRDGLGIGVVDSIVYCIGGWTNGSPAGATGAVEAYDPISNTWNSRAPMPIPVVFWLCVS